MQNRILHVKNAYFRPSTECLWARWRRSIAAKGNINSEPPGAQTGTVRSTRLISMTKYLRDRTRDDEAALRRTVSLLLQLIEIHAIEGDALDYVQFRSGIHEITSRFSENTPSEEILVISGKVATSFKEY